MAQTTSPRTTPATVMILTTAQWKERSNANIVIPFGCFCVEIISDDLSAKLKVGDGKKHYSELPYAAGGGSMDDYYTKEEIDALLGNLPYMSIVATGVYPSPSSLPPTGNRLGDVRFVKNTSDPSSPIPYLWNGTKWLAFADTQDIDLSAYAKKSEVNPRLDRLESEAHIHANKDILDQINANVIRYSHTHLNKQTLDRLTPEVIDNSHTHANKDVLDATTASYTEEEKTKLASLKNYEPFIGTDGTYDGDEGLVPAPMAEDAGKFLGSDGEWHTVTGAEYQPGNGIEIDDTTIPATIGVNIGTGLAFDENGAIVATGSAASEYVAGDGISIDEGEGTTDITNITWTQGSISDVTGLDDDTTDRVIRSDYLPTEHTSSIGLTATTTDSHDMLFKIAFYDSNYDFISMVDTWETYADLVNKPMGAAYIRICLESETLGVVDENSVGYAELSYPIETDKIVISNTGVTHISLEGDSVVKIENGETSNVVTFGSDFSVSDGTVNIADFNRLILNVEE